MGLADGIGEKVACLVVADDEYDISLSRAELYRLVEEHFREVSASLPYYKRVKVLHVNDSKKELGSRVDRHAHIGRGLIGIESFKPWVRDEAFRDVPKILETEKGQDEHGREWDAINLEVLRSLL